MNLFLLKLKYLEIKGVFEMEETNFTYAENLMADIRYSEINDDELTYQTKIQNIIAGFFIKKKRSDYLSYITTNYFG